MKKWAPYVLLGLILLLAGTLRLSHLDWDDYNHYHPDERYISWVATSIEWPESLSGAFDPQSSSFNPYYWPPDATSPGIVLEQDLQRRFAYGHLPLYMGVAATRLMEELEPSLGRILPDSWRAVHDILNTAERNEYRHITATGRAVTALIDTLSVLLIFILGRQIFDVWTGLLAATLATVTVEFIQLAHFFAVDSYLTFFVILSITLLSFSLRKGSSNVQRSAFILLGAAAIGLAVGSKFTGLTLLLPLIVTVLFQSDWSRQRQLLILAAAILILVLVFLITNPFAILDHTCEVTASKSLGPIRVPNLFLGSCYLQNIGQQATMVQGTRDVPFVRQYAGTTPYLYYFEMILRWGMGFVLGLVAFAGFGWGIWRFGRVSYSWWRQRRTREDVPTKEETDWQLSAKYPFTVKELVLLSWTIPFFISTGALSVKFMRYMEPLLPFLIIYGAAMLLSIRKPIIRATAIALTLAFTGVYAFSFINIYQQPHPWISASLWMYENIDDGAVISTEAWDDRLPDSVVLDGSIADLPGYVMNEVNWLSGTESSDDEQKLIKNLEQIADADYLVMATNRNYGVIPRLPDRYPLSSQYYQLLFDGKLGFEVAHVVTRMPNIFGLSLKPDTFSWPGLTEPDRIKDYYDNLPGIDMGRFDESFTVYDQPLVIIFENIDKIRLEEMVSLIMQSTQEPG